MRIHTRFCRGLLAIGMIVTACGCHKYDSDGSLWRAGRERLDDVCHIVVFWLKQPGDEEARRRIIEASESFIDIPGVVTVEAGEALHSPRPNVDKTCDVVVYMWFQNRQALEEYQSHPKHQAMLKEVGPLVERVVVYDFLRSPEQATK